MQKGTKTSVTAATENAHYALMELQRLKLLPRSGNGIVPQKLKLCKQPNGRQQDRTCECSRLQSFCINAIYSSNLAFYVRAQHLTQTHRQTD